MHRLQVLTCTPQPGWAMHGCGASDREDKGGDTRDTPPNHHLGLGAELNEGDGSLWLRAVPSPSPGSAATCVGVHSDAP